MAVGKSVRGAVWRADFGRDLCGSAAHPKNETAMNTKLSTINRRMGVAIWRWSLPKEKVRELQSHYGCTRGCAIQPSTVVGPVFCGLCWNMLQPLLVAMAENSNSIAISRRHRLQSMEISQVGR